MQELSAFPGVTRRDFLKICGGLAALISPDEAGVVALRSNSIHGMGVPHLVANARLSGADPDVVVYAVQVGDVRPRPDELTPEVDEAVAAVAAMVREDIGRLA